MFKNKDTKEKDYSFTDLLYVGTIIAVVCLLILVLFFGFIIEFMGVLLYARF